MKKQNTKIESVTTSDMDEDRIGTIGKQKIPRDFLYTGISVEMKTERYSLEEILESIKVCPFVDTILLEEQLPEIFEKPATIAMDDEVALAMAQRREEKRESRAIQIKKIGNSVISVVHFYRWFAWPFKKIFFKRKKDQEIQKEDPSTGSGQGKIVDIFASPSYHEIFGLMIPKNWPRVMMRFAVVAFLIMLPLQTARFFQNVNEAKISILANAKDAMVLLEQGRSSASQLEFKDAQNSFKTASQKFQNARQEFEKLHFVTKNILKSIPGERKKVVAGLNLLEAGESLSDVGQDITRSLEDLLSEKNNQGFLKKVSLLQSTINAVLPKVALAESKLTLVQLSDVSSTNRSTLIKAQSTLPEIKTTLNEFSHLLSAIMTAGGKEYWQRYLLLFQNPAELRGTGGFVGSFAELDIEDGKIKNINVPSGGSYDLSGSQRNMSATPSYYHLLKNPQLHFHDANIWPDFPTSAKKMGSLYQSAMQSSVDGIVAINAGMIERILDVTGPIVLENEVFTSDNVLFELQRIVEKDYEEENKPKKVIADLVPQIIDRIYNLEKDEMLTLGKSILSGLEQKEMMFYFYDENLQSIVSSFNWAGEVKQSKEGEDYLMVATTNIGGKKSDAKIIGDIAHSVSIQKDRVLNTVTITRAHTGEKEEEFYGAHNVSYVKIYTPLGSTLVDSSGFEELDETLFNDSPSWLKQDSDVMIYEGDHFFDAPLGTEIFKEAQKTVFAGWMLIKPGQTRSVTITYELPFFDTHFYSVVVQKQSGTKYTYELQINTRDKKLIKSFPENSFASTQNSWNISKDLLTDTYLGALFE